MAQTFVQNYTHIVFSTKNHKPLILPEYEERIFDYIGGICKNLECNPIQVGGYLDHVHVLCNLSKKINLSTLVEKVKTNSSKWIKTLDPRLKDFYWQNGYGAFSVSHGDIEKVKKYISNQREHHKKFSFKDEYLEILKDLNIDFNELYLWD